MKWIFVVPLLAVASARPEELRLHERFPVPQLGEKLVLRVQQPAQHLVRQPFQLHVPQPARQPPPQVIRPQPIPANPSPSEVLTFDLPIVQPHSIVIEKINQENPDSDDSEDDEVIDGPQQIRQVVKPTTKPQPKPDVVFVGQSPIRRTFTSQASFVRDQNPGRDQEATVLAEDRQDPTADGRSGVSYETSNGIKFVERTQPDEDGFNTITGSYSYISPEGKEIVVTYVADRNGFRYESDSLPQGPPIPPHAQEQLERGERLHREKQQRLAAGGSA